MKWSTVLELNLSPSYLPIRDIRNANAAWVRTNFGSLTSLKHSLAKEEMQLPILVLPDFVVADGARRLAAAEALRWREVPVVVANEWDIVPTYYERALELREDRLRLPYLPMHWVELIDLTDRILTVAYSKRRQEIRQKTKTERRKLREQGIDPGPSYNHSDFIGVCSRMFGFGTSDLRTMREIYSMINAIAAEDPELGKQLLAIADEVEKENAGLYGLLRLVREVKRGKPLEKYERGTPKRRLDDPPAQRAHNARIGVERQEKGQTATVQIVTNLATLLTSVAMEAYVYTSVDVKKDQEGDVQKAVDEIKSAVNYINSYRRRLEAAIATPRHK